MERREFLKASTMTVGAAALAVSLFDEEAGAAAKVIATIEIPRLKLKKSVYNSTDSATLALGGLGHWLGTAAPGSRGNCMLFGHRTTHGGPLRYLNTLQKGDAVKVAGVTYKVDSKLILPSSQIAKAIDWNPGKKRGLQLLACTKPNGQPTSLAFRYIVRAIAA